MGLRQKLKKQAEKEVNDQLQKVAAVVLKVCKELCCEPQDVCRALLPRNKTMKAHLVVVRLDFIENILVDRYEDTEAVT